MAGPTWSSQQVLLAWCFSSTLVPLQAKAGTEWAQVFKHQACRLFYQAVLPLSTLGAFSQRLSIKLPIWAFAPSLFLSLSLHSDGPCQFPYCLSRAVPDTSALASLPQATLTPPPLPLPAHGKHTAADSFPRAQVCLFPSSAPSSATLPTWQGKPATL